jgi:hypothetical protein
MSASCTPAHVMSLKAVCCIHHKRAHLPLHQHLSITAFKLWMGEGECVDD